MIETLLTAIAFGTFWFWLILSIASIIIIACVENEHYPTPSIVAILLGAVYWKQIIALQWQTVAIVAGIFVLAGIGWSVFNWFRFVNKKVVHYKERYGSALTESQMEDLENQTMVSKHKAMITGWIAFWPWSLFWTLTGDFFNMIYDSMVHVYQHITDRGLSKFTVKEPAKKEIITDAETDNNRARPRRDW